MKKLASILLALILLLSLSAPVFAASTDATISVEGNRTYDVYQIFTGDLSGTTLSNIKWGKNGKFPEGGKAGDPVDGKLLATLAGLTSSSDQDKLDKILDYVNLISEKYGQVSGSTPLSAPTGYYLLKDVTKNLGDGAEHSAFIVTLTKSTAIKAKAGTVTAEKKVQDKNDTTGDTSGWQDSADYDIGDEVPFQLKATISENYDSYNSYKLCFHDTLSTGLTFNNDVTVKVGETVIGSNKYTVTANPEDGCSFHVVFTDLKDETNSVSQVTAGSTITVEYTATLNDKAAIGSDGNSNTMHLEYSNDPNNSTSTNTTPDDTVTVFTYALKIKKIDGTSKEVLKGAGFTLYKKNPQGGWVAVGEEVKGENMTEFEWKGLDDGDYKLVETTTPPGYDTMTPIEFTITAAHDDNSATPKLTSLDGDDLGAGDLTTGVISKDIENNKGTVLPETGASGTTLFLIFGSMLTLAAVVFLVVRKKMSIYED